ncbi:MAG TPA: glycosyltransferase family 61 protein [Lacibacter sp.]|nr:glycosyltransferase family 61 protein [Lacibacter sp.]
MTDALPKIEIARMAGNSPEMFDNIIVSGLSHPFQRETLDLIGIELSKVVSIQNYPYVKIENALVTSKTCLPGNVPEWVIGFWRRVASHYMKADEKLPDRIYISRKYARIRRVINEDEVLELLVQSGFTCVFMESLSFIDQIKIFHNARIVVAPHGASLTNLMFSSGGARVIELFPDTYVNQCYWTIASTAGLDYSYLIGNAVHQSKASAPWMSDADFLVDINQLKSLIHDSSTFKVFN